MTRFQADLQGFNGEYWQKDAEKELQQIKADLEAGPSQSTTSASPTTASAEH